MSPLGVPSLSGPHDNSRGQGRVAVFFRPMQDGLGDTQETYSTSTTTLSIVPVNAKGAIFSYANDTVAPRSEPMSIVSVVENAMGTTLSMSAFAGALNRWSQHFNL